MRSVLLFLLFSLLVGAQSLKIASWNVENLFDLQRQGTEYEEYIPGRHGWNKRTLEKKLNHLAEVICDLDADILALQEVESDRVLARLQTRLKEVGCSYPYRYITRDRQTPVHVALLSRKRLEQRRDLRITPYGRYRSILEAVLPSDPPLRLFVNHWRSKSGPESERVRYALALKRRLERLPAGSEYILLGDFNSDYREDLRLDRKHNDTHGITGIDQILGTVQGGRLLRRNDLQSGKYHGLAHYTLWLELPPSQRWSHNFYGDKEAIDAILIPPTLMDGRGWEYLPGSFGVFRPTWLFGPHGEVKRWEYRHGRHTGRGFSDHLPIYARFENLGSGRKKSGMLQKVQSWLGIGTSKKRASGSTIAKSSPSKKIDRHEETTIRALQSMEKLSSTPLLKDAAVVFKRGRSAVLQQSPEGPAILVYKAAGALKEGHRYDLRLYGFKRRNGMPQITDLAVIADKGSVDLRAYLHPFRPSMMRTEEGISRIVGGIEGVYRGHRLHTAGSAWPIYFKKRRWIPPEGSRIMIKRAQIGYYKNHKELVVWDRRDFEIRKKK